MFKHIDRACLYSSFILLLLGSFPASAERCPYTTADCGSTSWTRSYTIPCGTRCCHRDSWCGPPVGGGRDGCWVGEHREGTINVHTASRTPCMGWVDCDDEATRERLMASGSTRCDDDDDDDDDDDMAEEENAGGNAGRGNSSGRPGCTNTCRSSHDDECDDGGPGSEYSSCSLGTDCADCGPRVLDDDSGLGCQMSPATSPIGGLLMLGFLLFLLLVRFLGGRGPTTQTPPEGPPRN